MSDPLKLTLEQFFKDALDIYKIFGLRVDGIEITQSTQYYHASDHLTDAAVRGPDNSIPLIAGKSALVRVYVRNRAGPLSGVTGTLKIERLSWRAGPTVVKTLMPLPPGTTTAEADPDYAGERGSLDASLNFRIPAALVGYRLRLTAQVRSADGADTDEMSIDVTAGLRQTLRVRGIAISYRGPDAAGNDITLARPTLADFARTAATAVAMFPVEDQPDITLTGDFNWFAPLSGAPDAKDPGGCAPSWNALLYWLNLLKSADGNRTDRIYYGLAPAAIPIGFNSGCGGQGGVGAGLVGDAPAFAHECGHVLGFGHAPCNLTPGDPNDPNYPAYRPYDTPAARMASIGEYGVDLRNNAIAVPAVSDFMSYCGSPWIGPYHYRALIGHALLDPRHLTEPGPKLPDWVDDQFFPELDLPRPGPIEFDRPRILYRMSKVQPLILVTGLLRGGRFEQLSVLRLPTRPGPVGTVVPGVAVEVRDRQGVLVDRARLRRAPLFASGCGCGSGEHGGYDPEPGFESGLVEAVLPDRDDIGEIRIVRDDAVLWSRLADEQIPVFETVSASVEGDELLIRWVVRGASPQTHYILRWSRARTEDRRAEDWETLTIVPGTDPARGAPASEARVAVAALRPGQALVEVVAVDGLHTVVSSPADVTIPDRPPAVAILWPREGSVVLNSEPVRLWGMAASSSGERLPDDLLSWTLDGHPAGQGSTVEGELGGWEGEHRATLTVRTETGSVEASVTFLATCSGDRPRRYLR
ncbi:hypothetical protein M0208_13830 [Sphingomonas sp. SUN019]|uniref:hypothetical protein n=1 Tax=Sphingomonas sp. SUN019 TaxID=2937788 RepID=UPI00216423B1|nr:hypothetical protein [Sphingomonas sp. SUN019]UVO51528.1 hypothetical protein M0208_13830 [Sphingomonas sp. SUN019]